MKTHIRLLLKIFFLCLPLTSLAKQTGAIQSDSTAVMSERVVSVVDASWVLKTNLLYDALLSPSIEAEYRFSTHWSAHVDFAIAWWSNKSKHKYYQLVQLSPEARYWFNGKQAWKGHYIGAFVGAGHYDLSGGEDGYKGEFMMAGLSYGYMFPIGRYLSLEAGIGLGYLNTEYEEYLPIEGHYVYQQKSRTGYVGPVKAKLSLVWHIGRSLSKGGGR